MFISCFILNYFITLQDISQLSAVCMTKKKRHQPKLP